MMLLGWKFFSDGKFSGLLSLAAFFQTFAFGLLLYKVESQRSIEGLSMRTMHIYGLIFPCRLLSTAFFNGYVPADSTGDYMYQISDTISMCIVIWLIFRSKKAFRSTYDWEVDTFMHYPVVAACAVLAAFLKPANNELFIADMSWTLAMFLEAFAMLPQIFLMSKLGQRVEAMSCHFVFCQAITRLVVLLFWAKSYRLLGVRRIAQGENGPYVVVTTTAGGYAVLVSTIIGMLLFSDYVFVYLKSLWSGRHALRLPTHLDMNVSI